MQELTAPSKTFFIGEYAVLAGYPALVATTPPYFRLTIAPAAAPEFIGIHPDSPAGKFWAAEIQSPVSMRFHDPHEGRGGYGASTAQFLLLYQWVHQIENWDHPQLKDLLACYKRYAGSKPSGADILSQAVGGFVIVNPQQALVEKTDWPFHEMTWQLHHTGEKCATHTHLDSLSERDFSPLGKIAESAIQAFRAKNRSDFINCINQYYQTLLAMDLVQASTVQLIHDYLEQPKIIAAKGCGALGADVVLTFSESSDEVAS